MPPCAGLCHTLPNGAENARFSMGFKRSRVQISPARYFENKAGKGFAGDLIFLEEIRDRPRWSLAEWKAP